MISTKQLNGTPHNSGSLLELLLENVPQSVQQWLRRDDEMLADALPCGAGTGVCPTRTLASSSMGRSGALNRLIPAAGQHTAAGQRSLVGGRIVRPAWHMKGVKEVRQAAMV